MTDQHVMGALLGASDVQTRHVLSRLPKTACEDVIRHYRNGPTEKAIYLTGSRIADDTLKWLSIHHHEQGAVTSCIVFDDVVVQGIDVTIRGGLPETAIQSMKGQELSAVLRHGYASDAKIIDAEMFETMNGDTGTRLTIAAQ